MYGLPNLWTGFPQPEISLTHLVAQEQCFSNSRSQSINRVQTSVVGHKEYLQRHETILLKTSASMSCFKGNYSLCETFVPIFL